MPAKANKIDYKGAPGIKEGLQVINTAKKELMYGVFDLLKLGISPSEQLTKSLSKIRSIAHKAEHAAEEALAKIDLEHNKLQAEGKKGSPLVLEGKVPSVCINTVRQFFSLYPSNFGDLPRHNFMKRTEALGHFIFSEKERFEFFMDELVRVHDEKLWEGILHKYAKDNKLPSPLSETAKNA